MTSLIETILDKCIFEENNISIYGTYENPLFIAKDILTILELDMKTYRRIPEKYKYKAKIKTKGGIQTMNMLTVKGMYRVILRSNKSDAEKFQDWVYDVLESIRKTGMYELSENEKKLLAENRILEKQKIQLQETNWKLVNELREKNFYRAVKINDTVPILHQQTAKEIENDGEAVRLFLTRQKKIIKNDLI